MSTFHDLQQRFYNNTQIQQPPAIQQTILKALRVEAHLHIVQK